MSEDTTSEPEGTEPDGEATGDDETQVIQIKARTLWDAVEQLFNQYYDGVLVRGALLLDIYSTDGLRNFDWEIPDDMAPWDLRAMLQECELDLNASKMAVAMAEILSMLHEDEDDEDEVEGESDE